MSVLPVALLVVAIVGLPLLYYFRRRASDSLHAPSDFATERDSFEPTMVDIRQQLEELQNKPEKTALDVEKEKRLLEALEHPDKKSHPLQFLPAHAASGGFNAMQVAKPRSGLDHRVAMEVLLTLTLAGASLFVILSQQYDPNLKHWAFSTLGTITGFWLKGVR